MAKRNGTAMVPAEHITRSILLLRHQKVLLDEELAALYGVTTSALLQAVKRNRARFPADFMFQLNAAEWRALRSQTVISKAGRGGRRYPPYAFTEQGVAMLSSVLHSDRAAIINIEIMRAFVRMRVMLGSNRDLARRLNDLEARITRKLATQDETIVEILAAIRRLTSSPVRRRRAIGFTADLDEKV